MTVAQLRALLRSRGLATTGNRLALCARLSASRIDASRPADVLSAPRTATVRALFGGEPLPRDDLRARQPTRIRVQHKTIEFPRNSPNRPDDDERRTAYIPVLRALPGDDPLKQKVGGHRPFFLSRDHWPTIEDLAARTLPRDQVRALAFVMQFLDPPAAPTHLVQLFFPDIDNNDDANLITGSGEPVYLRYVPLDAVTAPPYTIAEPRDAIRNQDVYDQPREIVRWLVRDEPDLGWLYQTLEDAGIDVHGGSWAERAYAALVLDRPGTDTSQVLKIGGFGHSTQAQTYTLFIQNLYNGQWGDAGVLHVSRDGKLYGDQ